MTKHLLLLFLLVSSSSALASGTLKQCISGHFTYPVSGDFQAGSSTVSVIEGKGQFDFSIEISMDEGGYPNSAVFNALVSNPDQILTTKTGSLRVSEVLYDDTDVLLQGTRFRCPCPDVYQTRDIRVSFHKDRFYGLYYFGSAWNNPDAQNHYPLARPIESEHEELEDLEFKLTPGPCQG